MIPAAVREAAARLADDMATRAAAMGHDDAVEWLEDLASDIRNMPLAATRTATIDATRAATREVTP